MHFQNLRLSKQLYLGFGMVVVIAAAGAGFVTHQTLTLSKIERVSANASAALDDIDRARAESETISAQLRKYVMTGTPADRESVEQAWADYQHEIDALRTILDREAPQFIRALDVYLAAARAYYDDIAVREMSLSASAQTRPQAVAMVVNNVSGHYTTARQAARAALFAEISPWARGWTAKAEATMSQTIWTALGGGALTVIMGMVMAWLMARAIGRPMAAMTDAMNALADGNNAIEIPASERGDELGDMAKAVQVFKAASIEKLRLEAEAAANRSASEQERIRNEEARAQAARQQAEVVQGLAGGLSRLAAGDLVQSLDQAFAADYEGLRGDYNAALAKLREAMSEVAGKATSLRSGANEISSASDDLSRRTEQQAASLEETAAALDQITVTVKTTAQGATQARRLVGDARQDAERSGEVVTRAVQAMDSIEQSSQQIGQIIGVIDEIAFQTNLLALNAGVEAARAGDAGRGFAVVASEVRALAQRSAEAAKEIKSLIRSSDDHVRAGVELVGEAGRALERISAQVGQINTVVGDIAASAQEQAAGLSQVNAAVNQMDQVTQQNAAMVEQSTAAAASLRGDTDHLAALIGRFKTGDVCSSRAVRRPNPCIPAAPCAAGGWWKPGSCGHLAAGAF